MVFLIIIMITLAMVISCYKGHTSLTKPNFFVKLFYSKTNRAGYLGIANSVRPGTATMAFPR